MKFPPVSDIRKLRKAVDLTQSDLSKLSGISQSTIAKIEKGSISASYVTIVKLFETLESEYQTGSKDLTAADVASKGVITIQYDETVHRASDLMQSAGYSQLPVLKGDMPVGSITERGIFEMLCKGKTMEDLGETTISKIMGDSYPVVRESTPISIVTSIMADSNAVLVSSKGTIVGMITNADMLKLV